MVYSRAGATINTTFPDRLPDDPVANAVRLKVQPGSGIDWQPVSTKHGDYAQLGRIERCDTRTNRNSVAGIVIESPVDLSYPLGHERSVSRFP